MSHGERRRPRPKALIRIDPDNAYARLGVSPRVPTEEIKRVIDEKRGAVSARRASRADGRFGAEEEEMAHLQHLEQEIGTPRARAAYDAAHPMNALLTVQGGLRERWVERGHRAGLVTEWLVSELGPEVFLPSPESLPLWTPAGFEPALLDELSPFRVLEPEARVHEVVEPLSARELERTQVATTPGHGSGKEQ